MKITGLFDAIDEVKRHSDNLKDFVDDNPIEFVRHHHSSWEGQHTYSTWKVFLDESKSKLCVRDKAGFKIIDRPAIIQRVFAPIGTRALLLSKNSADREVAKQALTVIAEKKYGKELGE